MQRLVGVILLLFVLLGAGCSVSNDVVGHGPFQKRKYRPGWNLELAGSRKQVLVDGAVAAPPSRNDRSRNTPDPPEIPIIDVDAPLEASTSTRSRTLSDAPSLHRQNPKAPLPELHIAKPSVSGTLPGAASPEPAEGDQPRRWNRMALISGIFLVLSALVIVLSGFVPVLLYLIIFALITGTIGLLLAIKHDEKGKGIGIAAVAFSVGVIVLALVSLYNDM